MPYIETPDEIPIYYLDEGPRTNSGIFLIHAEPFNSKFWQKNISDLARSFRVVPMDVRGRGESGKTDDGQNIAQYARDFRHMLESLGLQRVVVVGWSLGGSIIWNYMQQFGDDRLVGNVIVDQLPYRYVSEEHFQEQQASVQDHRMAHHRGSVLRYLGEEVQEDEGVVKWMVYECMKTPTSAHCAAFTESYHSDYRPFLNQVRIPTRLFWARFGSIQPDMAKSMSEVMADCRLVFFEHSGHLIPWVESEKFNHELLAFAEEVLPPTER